MAAPKQFAPRPGYNSGGNRGGANNRNNNRRNDFGPRRNERIRATEVRCIGPNGEQLGIISTRDALEIARARGLDLLEIAPMANPPVCRVVDYGKYLYEESKKQKQQKQVASKMKEVKMRPRIDEHDLLVKVRRAEMFLYNGNKVKVTLMFRFRELEHPEFGFETIKRLIDAVANVGMADNQPRLMGRSITTMLTPLPQSKRKLVYNAEPIKDEDVGEDDDTDAAE